VTPLIVILAFVLVALVQESHRRNVASHRPAPFEPDRDLRDLRDYYTTERPAEAGRPPRSVFGQRHRV
jgi:hypothetical protein